MDGEFWDWDENESMVLDAVGDNQLGGVDILAMSAKVSATGLALYLEAAVPFNLEDSEIKIYVDSDADLDTGIQIGGIGADFSFDFRRDEGQYLPPGVTVRRREVISQVLPLGTSAQFEIEIPLAVLPKLASGGRVSVQIRNGGLGDRIPETGQVFSIPVPSHVFIEPRFQSFEKVNPEDIRIATWNVLFDGPMDLSLEDRFGRLLQATEPDIINFQEMWESTTTWVHSFMDKWLPLEGGEWHVEKNADCVTVSRFPVSQRWTEDGNLIVWLNMQEVWGFDTVIVNAHTPCCENQSGRKRESDNLMLLVRRLNRGFEASAPDRDFTVMVTGDLNANPTTPEMNTVQNGWLSTPGLDSLSFWPDPYGRPLVDSAPRLTHFNRLFTFRNQNTTSSTNRIDYIFYQESRLQKRRSFVVETLAMPSSARIAANLKMNDSLASDHLLVVADFGLREIDLGWGVGDTVGNGWFRSDWFGWIYHSWDPFYYSEVHGFFYQIADKDGIWCWDQELGWWFTRDRLFPFVFSDDIGGWLYFAEDSIGERIFYDFSAGKWMSIARWEP